MSAGGDLAGFLLARVAEDERDAQAAMGDDEWQRWALSESGDLNEGLIVHLARRVHAECAVRRRVVATYEALVTSPPAADGSLGRICHWYRVDAYEAVLRQLAALYHEHPEYRAPW